MIKRRTLLVVLSLCFGLSLGAQDFTYQTFKDYRIINTHSVETLTKRKLDIRIGHRFGDLIGDGGGWSTFYGLETAQDVMIGAAYGITNNITVGLDRTKGSGPLSRLVNGTLKYRILHQKTDDSMPFTLTFVGITSVSTMDRDEENPESLNHFDKTAHRFIYTAQLLLARKFSDAFSLQLIPSYTHRNVVSFDDENGIISLGVATRIQINKVFGIIADATFPFSELRTSDNGFYPPIGIGLEIETGGHIFQINFTNATGISETDYIPNTRSNWGDRQFRLGFTISRTFNL